MWDKRGSSATLEGECAEGGEGKELTVDVVLVSAGMGEEGGGAEGKDWHGQNSASFILMHAKQQQCQAAAVGKVAAWRVAVGDGGGREVVQGRDGVTA